MLADVGLLLAPTFRSRAYAQVLQSAGLCPPTVVLLRGAEPAWTGAGRLEVAFSDRWGSVEFRPGEQLRDTLRGTAWLEAPSADVRDPSLVDLVKQRGVDVMVYSGPAGVILPEAVLARGVRFLHVHGGVVPPYRGSTAFYYSLLERGTIGVTALWLQRGLDEGPIVDRVDLRPPLGVDIDRVVDPLARALLLRDVLSTRVVAGSFPSVPPAQEPARMHYVIHPVLKHLALRRAGVARRPA